MKDYERLTSREPDMGYGRMLKECETGICNDDDDVICGDCRYKDKAINSLAELEDMIESGKLIELPCKVGDTVYYLQYFCDYKGCSIDEQTYCCGCKEMIERERKKEKYVIGEKKFALRDLPLVEKHYFLTKEAAEAKLAELRGEE